MTEGVQHATELLRAHTAGNPDAARELMPLVYGELREVAARMMRGERASHTLQATALVHEAFVRLVDRSRVDWKSRSHFHALAATTLRRILVDHARKNGRRGGRSGVELEEEPAGMHRQPLDVLALEEALTQLAELSPRQSRVVELRFFGGMTVDEAALVLGVSPRTVKTDWAGARAWLLRRMDGGEP